jgi:hypothetical protein
MVQAASSNHQVYTLSYPRVLVSDEGHVLILRGWRYPALVLSACYAKQWADRRYLSNAVEIHGVLANAVIVSLVSAGSKFSLSKRSSLDPLLKHSDILVFEAPNGMRVAVVDDDLLVLAHGERLGLLEADLVVSPSYYRVMQSKTEARLDVGEIVNADLTMFVRRQDPKPDVSERRLLALYEEALRR